MKKKYEICIHGDVIGTEEWVENVLIPVLKEATYEWGWKLRYFNWEEDPEEAKDIWGLI